jgi:GT2 family glycosyltransferase
MTNPANIYCIIATYNAANWIEKCLKSVSNSSVQCVIVVVDNKSTDQTISIIESGFPEVMLIRNEENVGFGKANNIGIRRAYQENADYFFLLNQDAWVETDTIQSLVEIMQNNPEYGIVSPLQFYDSETLDRKFNSYLNGKGHNLIHNISPEIHDTIHQVRFVNAAVWMISRRCIKKVGLFAPIFDQYGEDLNYAHRCKFHDVKIGVYPKAIAFHEREQNPPKEKGIPLKKLVLRDKHYCFGILMNLKHPFLRQFIFLYFNSLKELITSLLLLRFKTVVVILSRIKCIFILGKLKNQRQEMKKTGSFLLEY